MILDSRDSLYQNLDSLDSQLQRAGKFPEIDEGLARNGCGYTVPRVGLCQVPAVMSRMQAEASHMVLGVSAHSTLHSELETQAFLYLQGKVIALDLAG